MRPSLRLDHILGPKLSVFVRYNYAPSSSVTRGSAGAALSGLQNQANRTQTLTGGFTHLVTPRIVNEARLNLSDSSVLSAYMLDRFLGAQPIAPAIAYPPGLSPANTQLQISP